MKERESYLDQRTAHITFVRESLGRWCELRVSTEMVEEFQSIIAAGVREMCNGASVEFEIVDEVVPS